MEESGGGDEGGGAGGEDGGGVGIVAKGGSAEEECVSVCECGRPCDLGRAEAGSADGAGACGAAVRWLWWPVAGSGGAAVGVHAWYECVAAGCTA